MTYITGGTASGWKAFIPYDTGMRWKKALTIASNDATKMNISLQTEIFDLCDASDMYDNVFKVFCVHLQTKYRQQRTERLNVNDIIYSNAFYVIIHQQSIRGFSFRSLVFDKFVGKTTRKKAVDKRLALKRYSNAINNFRWIGLFNEPKC